jgi:hypothetical protein
MIGEEEATLLVGSGNLTQSGFMDNTELFDSVALKRGGPNKKVAEDIITFLSGLRGLWDGIGRERFDLLVLPWETGGQGAKSPGSLCPDRVRVALPRHLVPFATLTPASPPSRAGRGRLDY